ncbi:MAG: zinc ribbon domain-containing protein [Chloroflexi bacterium]|nr:zinc ribbon domain-containing protein [Chloroflexota bacterium]
MFEDLNSILMGATVYLGIIAVAFWLALIVWAYRDIRVRSRDRLAHLLVALLVAALTLPGLLIYLLLRPRETLTESYERSLEEEALLQEIEEKPVCPGCGQRVKDNWQVCPSCHTRLKKPCPKCANLLELSWNLCPHCATPQINYNEATASGHVRPASVPEARYEPRTARGAAVAAAQAAAQSQSIQYVESDEY